MSRLCIICGDQRDDGNDFINEDFCAFCLATEIEVLHEIQRRREIKEALEDSIKDVQEPR